MNISPYNFSELKKLSNSQRGALICSDAFFDPDCLENQDFGGLEAVKNGRIIRAFVNKKAFFIACGGLKCGEVSVEAPGTILVIKEPDELEQKKSPGILIEPRILDLISLCEDCRNTNDFYMYNYKSTFIKTVDSLLTNPAGILKLDLIKQMNPELVNKYIPENDCDTVYERRLLCDTALFVLREANAYHSGKDMPNQRFHTELHGASWLPSSSLEAYLAWINAGMPCNHEHPWISYMFEYVNGLEAAFILRQNTEDEYIIAISDVVQKICDEILPRINKKTEQLDFCLPEDELLTICLATRIISDLLMMLASLDVVTAPKRSYAQNGWRIFTAFDKAKELLDTIISSGIFEELEIGFEFFMEFIHKSIVNFKTFGKEVRESLDYWYRGRFLLVSKVYEFITNKFLGDSEAQKRRVLIELFESDVNVDLVTWDAIMRGVIKPMCMGGSDVRSYVTVRKEPKSFSYSLTGRTMMSTEVYCSIYFASDYGLNVCQRIYKAFSGYSSLNLSCFEENPPVPNKIMQTELVLAERTSEKLRQENYIGDDVFNLRSFLMAPNNLRRYLEKPADPFAEILDLTFNDSKAAVVPFSRLAECITIKTSIRAIQFDLVESALEIWGYKMFPERVPGAKRIVEPDNAVLIYHAPMEFLDTKKMYTQVQEMFMCVFTTLIFRFIAGVAFYKNPQRPLDVSELTLEYNSFLKNVKKMPLWSEQIIKNSDLEEQIQERAELCCALLNNGGRLAANTLLQPTIKEVSQGAPLLVNEDTDLVSTLVCSLLRLASFAIEPLPSAFNTLIGNLCGLWLSQAQLANLVGLAANDQDLCQLASSLKGSATAVLKAGTEVTERVSARLGIVVTLENNKRRASKSKKTKDAELSAPIKLDINEERLSNVLKTTAEARESLDKIFNAEDLDEENAEVAAIAAGVRSLRNNSIENENDAVNTDSQPDAETKKESNTDTKPKAKTAGAKAKAEAETKTVSNSQNTSSAKATTGTNGAKSTKNTESTTSKSTKTRASKVKLSDAELKEMLFIIGSKESWQESELRRAFGKRPVMLNKFIDRMNEASLAMFDDYVVNSEDGIIEVNNSYMEFVFEDMKGTL